MATTGIAVGDRCYIGNQGSISVAQVVALHRSRVTIKWRNSARECVRDVGICYDSEFWIHGPKSTSGQMLPRFVCSPREQEALDKEPRIKDVVTLLCPAAA